MCHLTAFWPKKSEQKRMWVSQKVSMKRRWDASFFPSYFYYPGMSLWCLALLKLFYTMKFFIISSDYPFNNLGSIVISLFISDTEYSCFITFKSVLLGVFQFYQSFQKTLFFDLVIFVVVLFLLLFSSSLISALIFIISLSILLRTKFVHLFLASWGEILDH